MTRLVAEDLPILAELIARACRSTTEVLRIPQPPLRKKVREVRVVRTSRSIDRPVDDGPETWTVALTAGSLALGFLAFLAMGWTPLLFVPILSAAAGVGLGRLNRRVGYERATIEEETPVEEEREVLVPRADAIEQRRVPPQDRVVAIGRIALDFLALPVHDRILVVDPYGMFESRSMRIQGPSDSVATAEALHAVEEATREIPAFLEPDGALFPVSLEGAQGGAVRLHGRERELWESYDRLESVLADLNVRVFQLCAVPDRHPLMDALQPSADIGPITGPVLEARGLIETLAALLPLLEGLDGARAEMVASHAAMTGARLVSLRRKVGPMCHNLGQVFHYSAFHFYCSACNAELQKDLLSRDYSLQSSSRTAAVAYSVATRLQYDTETAKWRCPQCESLLAPEATIPVHRMLDEVFLPVYDRLMEENKNERLAVYADARQRELDYRNQLERDMDTLVHGTRSALESLEDEIRRLDAEATAEGEALAAFETILASHSVSQSGALRDIEAEARRIEARLSESRARKREDIEDFFSREREAVVTHMRSLSRSKRIDDERRDLIQRQIAANTTGILESNRDIARSASSIADSSSRTAAHTASAALSSAQTAAHAASIATSSAQSAANTAAIAEEQKYQSALQGAMATKAGVEIKPPWFDVAGRVNVAVAETVGTFMGDDGVRETQRRREAMR